MAVRFSDNGSAATRANVRVAFVAPTLDRGWRWQPVFRAFVKLFPETVVFTGLWPGFIQGYEGVVKIRQLPGVRFFTLRKTGAGSPTGFIWVSPLALWGLIGFRPDVILADGFNLCTFYALILKVFLGSRLILLWQGVSPETGGARGSVRFRLRKMMARFVDLAICNTREGADYLRNLVGIPPSKVWHSRLEVADRDALCSPGSAEDGLESADHPIFLFVGRIVRGKGIHKFLEACSSLVERGLTRFSVIIVGDGPHRDEFRQLARVLAIDNRIRWEGWVRYENVGHYYRACDVFVLPSLEDTWGVVVPEAMVFGKPILCSRYAGSRELVREGVNGYVFDACNPQELADYMARVIREPEVIVKFGSASKEIIAQYTPERSARVLGRAVAMLVNSQSGVVAPECVEENISSNSGDQEVKELVCPSTARQPNS